MARMRPQEMREMRITLFMDAPHVRITACKNKNIFGPARDLKVSGKPLLLFSLSKKRPCIGSWKHLAAMVPPPGPDLFPQMTSSFYIPGVRFSVEVISLKSRYIMVFALLLVMIGLASAQVTIQSSAGETGSVYTTGSIYVDSAPAGGSAVLDGGVGQLFTPGTFTGVQPGMHNVRIAKPGYQPSASDVDLNVGETKNVIVTLSRVDNPGSISVSSTPRGVGLYVDDFYQGKTDQIVGSLAPGPHKVTLAEPGFVTWSEIVTVTAGDMATLTVTLVPEDKPPTGDLQVSSTPTGAVVYLDSDYKGFTPPGDHLDILDLAPGTYALVLRKLGYQDYSTSVTIQAGKIVQVSASLTPVSQPPNAASADIVSTPSGAEVFINSVYMGLTPLSFQNVTPGTYTIMLQLQGYTPFTTTGQVLPGQSIQVIAALSPAATPATPTPSSPLLVLVALGMVSLAAYLMKRP
jgi:hypothetical protein